jgi:hypothetical protein
MSSGWLCPCCQQSASSSHRKASSLWHPRNREKNQIAENTLEIYGENIEKGILKIRVDIDYWGAKK